MGGCAKLHFANYALISVVLSCFLAEISVSRYDRFNVL